MVMMVFSLRV